MNVEERVLALENKTSNHEIRLAVAENNIDQINRKLDKIDANLSKVLWIMIAAVVGAVLKLVISGGF